MKPISVAEARKLLCWKFNWRTNARDERVLKYLSKFPPADQKRIIDLVAKMEEV